jgi:hypothetical protein
VPPCAGYGVRRRRESVRSGAIATQTSIRENTEQYNSNGAITF